MSIIEGQENGHGASWGTDRYRKVPEILSRTTYLKHGKGLRELHLVP